MKEPLDFSFDDVPSTLPAPPSTPPSVPHAPRTPRAPPTFNATKLVTKINEMEKQHETEMSEKDMEIHFLRCSLP